jgi:hypothetical protein
MTMRDTILERDRALAGFAGQTIAEATPETIERAERIASGTIFFYGDTPVEVGLRDIDWTGSHLHHQEWPAQLNRFGYLGPLASAFRQTREERFAQAARAYIEDWVRTDPGHRTAEHCRPHDSTLNMSSRLGTSVAHGWAGVLPTFLASAAFDDDFLQAVMASVSGQGHYLARHLTAWGNWRIAELDALVFTALRLPFLENAGEMVTVGIEGMRNALATQFLPDGVHVERSPGYHDWMAEVAANYCDLARRFPEADARVDPEIILRAFDYSAQNELFGVNDSGTRHRDPETLRRAERRVTVLRRLFPDREITPTPPTDQVFADAGQVFLRSGWQAGADYLAFDASTWGGGHSHLSRLSFVFRSGGRTLIADPGILNYEMSDPLGPYGKSTRAHSTLNLNGFNQSGADAQLLRVESTSDTALVHAHYQGGYWPGEYGWSFAQGRGKGLFGSHDRILFWVKGEYLLALDMMEADRRCRIHNCWQLGPMEGWSADPTSMTAGAAEQPRSLRWWSQNQVARPPEAGARDANVLLELALCPRGARMECFEGSREPLRGWVGRRGHDAIAAPLVEFRYSSRAGFTPSGVLIVPFLGSARPDYRVKSGRFSGGRQVNRLEIGLPDGRTDHIAWSRGLSGAVDDGRPFGRLRVAPGAIARATPSGVEGRPLTTDAPFAWLRTDATGKPLKAFLLDGSYLAHHGDALHDSGARETRLVLFSA